AFLHGFEQRALRLRCGAIDFIGEQELREDRSAAELEAVTAIRSGSHYVRAHDVRRHKIGRELNATKIQRECPGKRLHQLRLAQPRHALEQNIAAGDDRSKHAFDDTLLADDDRADSVAKLLKIRAKLLRFGLKWSGVAHGGTEDSRSSLTRRISI